MYIHTYIHTHVAFQNSASILARMPSGGFLRGEMVLISTKRYLNNDDNNNHDNNNNDNNNDSMISIINNANPAI